MRYESAALKQAVNSSVFQTKRLGHGFISHLAVNHVGPQLDFVAFLHGRFPALVGDFHGVRQGGIGQGHGGRARHGPGHVGHAVVDHAVNHVNGIAVGSGLGGFETASLVDGHVHQDRTRLHGFEHFSSDQSGCLGSGHQHRADDNVGCLDQFPERCRTRIQKKAIGRHHIAQVTQPIQIHV